MNIVFIYTNINGVHEETYAFGLASLVAISKREGYSVKVLIIKSREDYGKILVTLHEFTPKVVALTSVSSQYTFVKEIADIIKAKSESTIIVCGGVHPTVMPESLLETTSIDGFFIGESEYSFTDFLKKVNTAQDFRDTENFCYRVNNTLKINPIKPFIQDLDSLPYPDKTTYPYIETVSQYGIAPFMFSRGCPYLCSYCCNHAIAKIYGQKTNKPRYRSPESSIREIEWTLKKFPFIKIIWCVDDTFGIDKRWREEFCKKYKERIKVKLTLNLRINIIDEEFIRLLKDAGCYRISFGLESGNEHVRNAIMKRHMSNDQIINAFALAKKYGIETNAFNIIGIPGETEEMIWDTININRRINPTTSGVNIFYPYKGTELGNHCYEEDLVNLNLVKQFSNERRDTVLNFPADYQKKLKYYYENWVVLVYPYDPVKRAKWLLMKNPRIWEFLRKTKRSLCDMLGFH